jgi:hypothetical protein
MRFPSMRFLTVKGLRWSMFGVLVTVVLWMIGLIPNFKGNSPVVPTLPQVGPVEVDSYTVILETEGGDPAVGMVAQLLGDGGPYACTTNSDGVCMIAHVPLLKTLSVRILTTDGKKRYETNVPPGNPTIRLHLPRTLAVAHVAPGPRRREVRTPPPTVQAAGTTLPPPTPVPSSQVVPVTPPSTPAVTPSTTPPAVRPVAALVQTGVEVPAVPLVPALGGSRPRPVRVYVEDVQLPEDARQVLDLLIKDCFKGTPYMVERARERADAVLQCLDPSSFGRCTSGPAVILALYDQAQGVGGRAHLLASRALNRTTVPEGYVLNVAEAATNTCRRFTDRADTVATALWTTSVRLASR